MQSLGQNCAGLLGLELVGISLEINSFRNQLDAQSRSFLFPDFPLAIAAKTMLAHQRSGCFENPILEFASIRKQDRNAAADVLGFILKAGAIEIEDLLISHLKTGD